MFVIIALLYSKYKMVSLTLESDEKDLEPKLEKNRLFLGVAYVRDFIGINVLSEMVNPCILCYNKGKSPYERDHDPERGRLNAEV
jgi:hypothetical protein